MEGPEGSSGRADVSYRRRKEMKDEKKFCFILCTNDALLLEECTLYLNRLYVPEGYTVDLITVTDARSMAAGYNEAMRGSDARYKIYLHQDVFILNRYFLYQLPAIFAQDARIGMIGMVGADPLDASGVMWTGKEDYFGAVYRPTEAPYTEDKAAAGWLIRDAECVDGFLMATAYDLPWREDLFDGFDFYDVSQSFEFRRAGYRVVVPEQTSPWCLHDDGTILTLYRYNHYRNIFLAEYGAEMAARAGR